MNDIIREFRGTDNLVYAAVTQDDSTAYVTGTVKELAAVATISKTTEQSSDTKYYDNHAAIVIKGEGADTVTLTVPALSLATVGELTGKTVDAESGALIDGESATVYFAIGYRLKLTDGRYRYCWRLKGTFQVPEETSNTENAGTDSTNQTLTFTGISTTHKFTQTGKTAKGVTVDEGATTANLSTWFANVKTPDNIEAGITIDSRLQAVSATDVTWYPENGGFNAAGPYAAGDYKWDSLVSGSWAITFTIAEGATADYVWADANGIHTGTVTGQTSFTLDEQSGAPSGFQITVHGLANGVATSSVYQIYAD